MSPHTNVGGDLFTVLSQLTRAAGRGHHAVAWIDAHRTGRRLGGGIVTSARSSTRSTSRSRRPAGGSTW
jgi:hypothetical protein